MTLPGGALVVGVGAARGVAYAELAETLTTALAGAGLTTTDVACIATLATKQDEPAIGQLAAALGADVVWLPAERLAEVPVPNPSAVVAGHVGTAGVAEAAALLASGGGDLVVAKTRSGRHPGMCTIAVARHRVGSRQA